MNLERLMLVFVAGSALLSLSMGSGFAMSSTNFEIRFDQIGSGGDDTSSSASYELRDAIGGNAIDPSTSTNYELTGGYRDGIFDEVATFSVHIMDRSSQVAATALASTTITVSSSAGFSSGDMVALVQNEGASQTTGVGRVTSTGAGSVVVDVLYPSAPTIDGTDDYLYNLDASSLSMGTLSESAVTTGILAWEIDADVDDGYGVYVFEDEDLSDSGDTYTITDVADGTVSVGVTEYGGISSDSTLSTSTFDTADTAFTTVQQLVGSRGTFSFDTRDFLTLKAAISSLQEEESYSHNLSLIYVGDY